MTALESEIRKIIIDYGFIKRLPEYPFPCLVIPKPVMDVLCGRLARLVISKPHTTVPLTTENKIGRIEP